MHGFCWPPPYLTGSRRSALAAASALVLAAVLLAALPAEASRPPRKTGPVRAVPTWRLAAPPNPTLARGTLSGIACPSETTCLAVGATVSLTGAGITLVERRSGSSWSVLKSADPVDDAKASLVSLSCASATSCQAVGSDQIGGGINTLAEGWNGKTWSLEKTADESGAPVSDLLDVSCATPTSCEAVGAYKKGSASGFLIEGWNGRSWAAQKASIPSTSSLPALSCPAAGDCTAVGQTDGSLLAVALRHGTWATQSVPGVPGSPFEGLQAVACHSVGACEATGFYDNSAGTVGLTLAERWNGSSWTMQTTPNPSGTEFAELVSVACSAAATCTAVGSWSNLAGATVSLAERLEGSSWSIQVTPNPLPGTGQLFAVACPTVSSCGAVGSYNDIRHGQSFVAVLGDGWNGTSWSIEKTVNPVGAGTNSIGAMSCVSSRFCMASAFTSSLAGDPATFERWNGSTWALGGFKSDETFSPTDVSCSSARSCVAVGSSLPLQLPNVAEAEAWSGSSWLMLPAPAGSDPNLNAVDCRSATFCMAVGNGSSVENPSPLVDIWNGSSWKASVLPKPPGGSFPTLLSVSCAAATTCVAIGTYSVTSEFPSAAFTAAWNGRSWKVSPLAMPSGVTELTSAAASCPTAGSCMAVGTDDKGSTAGSWAARLASGKWSLLPLAKPPKGDALLAAVSCTASTACTATGEYRYPGVGLSLAERWNGAAWSVQKTPDLLGAVNSVFNSVTCVSAAECIAAGYGTYPNESVGFAAVWR